MKNVKHTQLVISVIAISCITICEVFAICYGINGTALSGAIAAIVGITTYQVTKARIQK